MLPRTVRIHDLMIAAWPFLTYAYLGIVQVDVDVKVNGL
jgi:hypothetical protein